MLLCTALHSTAPLSRPKAIWPTHLLLRRSRRRLAWHKLTRLHSGRQVFDAERRAIPGSVVVWIRVWSGYVFNVENSTRTGVWIFRRGRPWDVFDRPGRPFTVVKKTFVLSDVKNCVGCGRNVCRRWIQANSAVPQWVQAGFVGRTHSVLSKKNELLE